ncbi:MULTISPECIES: hypothetical protein [unclassified Saccharibacter]|uniref:hypothetical protein n=1 Tax=unclassified Saccharibacter TaxID=2648722 RepID=UPI001324D869|nr:MULTISPECIES: hypothetical protein [unclassified Saccharibacter]MXV36941.1 hypothetical protein [Saccharibacter sp. EH611]MXV58569.1 hypothetical protein [Saccharibacter sp. EH70]MXV66075.1 hypothetical protein [Saccharibacter sp. EH60]
MTSKKFYTLSSLFSLALTVLSVCFFVTQEQDIYSFDDTLYWGKWERFSYELTHNPLYDLGKIFSSLWKREYNFLPVILPSIFYHFPIYSRLDYILSISIIYFIPSVILFSFFLNKIKENHYLSASSFISVLFPLTTAAFLAPTLRGYPDIGGLFFIILALFYSFKINLTIPQNIKHLAILSVLLWAAFAFRRWYLYTVISMYITIPVTSMILYSTKDSIKDAKQVIINIIKSGFLFLAFLAIFQGKVLYTILTFPYGQAYSAYQMGFPYSFAYTIHHISFFIIFSSLLGALLALLSKNRTYIALATACIFNEIISFSLFTRTQSPGVQHIIPFTLWATLLACFAHMKILDSLKLKTIRILYVLPLTLLLSFSWYNAFFIEKDHPIDSYLSAKTLPFHVDHYQNYLKMVNDIPNILGHNKRIFILSSSHTVLNDTTVTHLLHDQMSDQIFLTNHVDWRDRINTDIIKADYILVVDPIQTHLVPTRQRIITIPAYDLLHERTIGHAFEKTPYIYQLNNDATAYLYKKIRPVSKQEIHDFLDEHFLYYPQWRAQYNVDSLYMMQSSH